MDVQVVEPLLAEWHSCCGAKPIRASDLVPLPSANAIAPAGSRLHHRSILLGRFLAEMTGQTVGPWTVDRSEGPPSGATTATWYALRQVGSVSGPAIVPELVAPVAELQPEPKVSLRRQARRSIRSNFCSLQRLLERRLGEAAQRSSGTSPDDALVEAQVTLGLAKSLVDSIRIAPTIFPVVARKRHPSRIEFIMTDATRPQIDAPPVPASPAMDEPTDPGDDEQQQAQQSTESAEPPEPGTQAAILRELHRLYADEPDDEE